MSEKSREDEKLSFKEQILRDLEKSKSYEQTLAGDENRASIPTGGLSAEELMADSLSAVENIINNAPAVPSHPSQDAPAVPSHPSQDAPVAPSHPSQDASVAPSHPSQDASVAPSHPSQDVPASPANESGPRPGPGSVRPNKVEREYNETPTRVAVSYKTVEKKEEQARPEAPTPVTETVDIISDTPRRIRREVAKPVKSKKEKKSGFKAFFISLLIFLALLSAGGYFGYQYVLASLEPVDPTSKEYVTVQIPEGASVQEIGSTLEKAGLVKHGIVFGMYTKYKNYSDLKAGYYNLQKSMSTDD